MLITDYSSVYFDIAYMRKPIIFYQFDEEEFRRKHYQRGYLREENLGYKCKKGDTIQVNTKDLPRGSHVTKKEMRAVGSVGERQSC